MSICLAGVLGLRCGLAISLPPVVSLEFQEQKLYNKSRAARIPCQRSMVRAFHYSFRSVSAINVCIVPIRLE